MKVYPPEVVERGVMDFIAFETQQPSRVTVEPMRGGRYRVRVRMEKGSVDDVAALERGLTELLSREYTLEMEWSDEPIW